jgi:hypothetical protein
VRVRWAAEEYGCDKDGEHGPRTLEHSGASQNRNSAWPVMDAHASLASCSVGEGLAALVRLATLVGLAGFAGSSGRRRSPPLLSDCST